MTHELPTLIPDGRRHHRLNKLYETAAAAIHADGDLNIVVCVTAAAAAAAADGRRYKPPKVVRSTTPQPIKHAEHTQNSIKRDRQILSQSVSPTTSSSEHLFSCLLSAFKTVSVKQRTKNILSTYKNVLHRYNSMRMGWVESRHASRKDVLHKLCSMRDTTKKKKKDYSTKKITARKKNNR